MNADKERATELFAPFEPFKAPTWDDLSFEIALAKTGAEQDAGAVAVVERYAHLMFSLDRLHNRICEILERSPDDLEKRARANVAYNARFLRALELLDESLAGWQPSGERN